MSLNAERGSGNAEQTRDLPPRVPRSAFHFPRFAFVALAALACSDSPGPGGLSGVSTSAASLTPSWLAVATGDSGKLTAVDSLGDTIAAHIVAWSTSDSTVARVSPTGMVLGISPGTASIRATLDGATDSTRVLVAPPVLVGAGDIAGCTWSTDSATAALLDTIPGLVFTAGDNAYPNGTALEFTLCYDPTWGRHKERTRPSPGNHDYNSPGGAFYYGYFGALAGDSGLGYYSYDFAGWHIVSLNSNASMAAASAQETWLRADLAAHPAPCTLAYWHHPRFSSGQHGNSTTPQPLWQALYDAGADVVISGHDHTYERFAPQTPAGALDSTRGIREFVVGTGGASLYGFPTIRPNSEVRNNTTHGVLKLTLRPNGYDWEFISTAGVVVDSGTGTCH